MTTNFFCDGKKVKIIAAKDLNIGEFIQHEWLSGIASTYAKKGDTVSIYIMGVFTVPKLNITDILAVGEAVVAEVKDGYTYIVKASNTKNKPTIAGIVTAESLADNPTAAILLTNAGGQFT